MNKTSEVILKMPVGCLGETGGCGGSNGRGYDHPPSQQQQQPHEPSLDVVVTSTVLNAAEQFAFMQQTLLLQIFRAPSVTTGSSSSDGRGSSSGDSASSSASISCPTCIAFSDQCCQAESGLELFTEFVEINLQCYWDARLSDALNSLR